MFWKMLARDESKLLEVEPVQYAACFKFDFIARTTRKVASQTAR